MYGNLLEWPAIKTMLKEVSKAKQIVILIKNMEESLKTYYENQLVRFINKIYANY